jgi:phosphohistidine phosphatase
MLDEIHATPADASNLLVVAHNPGLVLLAMGLASDPDDAVAARVEHGVPTGGLIVFDFNCAWADIADGKGKTVFFGRPRDLMIKED